MRHDSRQPAGDGAACGHRPPPPGLPLPASADLAAHLRSAPSLRVTPQPTPAPVGPKGHASVAWGPHRRPQMSLMRQAVAPGSLHRHEPGQSSAGGGRPGPPGGRSVGLAGRVPTVNRGPGALTRRRLRPSCGRGLGPRGRRGRGDGAVAAPRARVAQPVTRLRPGTHRPDTGQRGRGGRPSGSRPQATARCPQPPSPTGRPAAQEPGARSSRGRRGQRDASEIQARPRSRRSRGPGQVPGAGRRDEGTGREPGGVRGRGANCRRIEGRAEQRPPHRARRRKAGCGHCGVPWEHIRVRSLRAGLSRGLSAQILKSESQ